MGMAASQVRFLSLQNRNSSINRQLTTLSNRKMALSRDMSRVALEYTNALNQTVLQWSNDSGMSYSDLTYDLLMRPNDLNTTLPYIVTDANTGKVVLNNDEIYDVNGNSISWTDAEGSIHDTLSYIDIAEMISSYSGVSTGTNGDVTLNFDNTSSVYSATDQYGSNVLYGTSAIDGAYYIPDTTTFSFNNTLRYSIFELLGLVTEQDIKDQNNLLVQLYGSPEAEASGVYPIGSAWGDYYIAMANLEAYEDYLNIDHTYTSAATFSGTSTTDSTTTAYISSDYTYSGKMVSAANTTDTSVNTTITQSSYTNSTPTLFEDDSAAVHVDTSTIVTCTDTGDYKVISNNSGYVTSYTNTDNSTVYTTTITSDGITYTYSIDDIWSNAVKKYQNGNTSKDYTVTDAKNSGVGLIDAIKNTGTAEGLILVASSGHSSLSDLQGDSYKVMGSCIDGFKSIFECNNVVDIDFNSIFEDAKQNTIELFYDNRVGGYDGATGLHSGDRKANEKAKPRAMGHNHIGYSCYGGVHSQSRAYVDVGCLFNTFLTYCASDSANNVLINTIGPIIDYNRDENSGSVIDTSIVSIGDGDYIKSTYGTDSDGNALVNYSKLVETTCLDGVYTYVDEDDDGNEQTYEDTATVYVKLIGDDGSYIYVDNAEYESNPLSYAAYELGGYYWSVECEESTDDGTSGRDSSDEMDLIYHTDGRGNYEAINCTPPFIDNNGTEYNEIYGTLEIGGTTYYFVNTDSLDEFLRNGDYSGAVTYANSAEASVGTDSDATYTIASTASASSYGYTIAGTPIESESYHNYLKDEVNKAWDRIVDLEDQLENFYSAADKKLMDYYDALFLRIAQNGWVEDKRTSSENSNSTTYLNNKLQNYDYFLTVCQEKVDNVGYNYTSKMATSVTKVYQVHDNNAETQALAEYELKKTEISNKEEVIDVIMDKLETEYEANKTMMDSMQNIISDNIDKNFKIFA